MDFSRREELHKPKGPAPPGRRLTLNGWVGLLTVVWTAAVLVSLGWNVQQLQSHAIEQAQNELRANFFKDLTLRRWATRHGGIYVPVSETTHADPYTAFLPERDVTTPSGRTLTLINPATILRELYELGKEVYGAQGHISSLRPLNPRNQPDHWEQTALLRLIDGQREVTEVAEVEGEPHLRLIRPLFMSDDCLKCHKQQGYHIGEVGGAVSVSVPLRELLDEAQARSIDLGIGHGLLWILGLAGLQSSGRQIAKRVRERESAYRALEEKDERMRAVLSTSLDAIITIDGNDVITSWNEQAERIFGWKTEEAVGQHLADTIIPFHSRQTHRAGVRRYLETGTSRYLNRRFEQIALHRTGRTFPIELSLAVFRSNGRTVFSAFVRDISDRRRAEEKIRRDYHSQRILAAVLETSLQPISFREKLKTTLELILSTPWLSLQAKGAIFTVEPGSTHLILMASHGMSPLAQQGCSTVRFGECLCGRVAQSGEMIFAASVDHRHDHVFSDLAPHGHYCLPIQSAEKLLGVLNLYLQPDHEKNDDEIHFLSAIANTLGGMIQRHLAEDKLRHYAYYDQLTGLPNRALFMDRLEHCLRRTEREADYRVALLFLDLDRFKNINDSLGHAAGDEMLKTVAHRIESCTRPSDSIARLGGDEFTILMEDFQDMRDALHVAHRIHSCLSEPLLIRGQEIFTSASIGVALNQWSSDPMELLRDADTAMYRAKARGAGQTILFDAAMHSEVSAQLTLETQIRRAVEHGDFLLHFQPIISSKSRRLCGLEALVRWSHPSRGLIGPGEFISVAEETGLIHDIGKWVLNESLRQLQSWQRDGFVGAHAYVSVNLSARQFLQKDFLQDLDAALSRFSVEPSWLRFELTESLFMEDLQTARRLLHEIKDRGVRLFIDDFGTGYSSLSYLHQLPFDALKIDRCFVANMGRGERHDGLVQSIIAIARHCGMDVIAEGVETDRQSNHLTGLGCQHQQGYYFSRPVPTDAVRELFTFDWEKFLAGEIEITQ